MTCADNKHSYLSSYPAAAERTLRQFIEAFWFEDALNGKLKLDKDGVPILHLRGMDENRKTIEYQMTAYPHTEFNRTRLIGALRTIGEVNEDHDISSIAANLLRHLELSDDKTERFIAELKHTAIKQACSMTAKRGSGLKMGYNKQEAQLGDGHLYHPCYRSRMGFSLADHLTYGPEFAQAFSLVWLAIEKNLCDIHTLDDTDYAHFLKQELAVDELARLTRAVASHGYNSADYYLIPAHPWHWENSLQVNYAHWLADGKLVYLGTGSGQWLAQQSIRSLSSLEAHARFNIKLPLAIANSSADRILSDHHVHNAPVISQWLTRICAQDTYLNQHSRLEILREPIGITLKPHVTRKDTYGLLGAIWRQSPESILRHGEQIFPCTALTTLCSQQQPSNLKLEITPWLEQHGTEIWVNALLSAMLPPFLHLMLAHGVLLEAHAQNTLLILKDGLPVGVAIRDLPGGLHYIAGHTTNEEQLSQLRQAPGHRNAANASSGFAIHSISEARDYLLEVLLFIHLSELAHRLERFHDFSEARFWQLAARAVLAYQAQVPQLADRFALFDLFTPEIQVERLATRRLFASTTQHFHAAPNPLHKYHPLRVKPEAVLAVLR
jgi:siderophore synthetase component